MRMWIDTEFNEFRGMSDLDYAIFPCVIHLRHCAVAFDRPCNCDLGFRRQVNESLIALSEPTKE